MVKNTGKNLTKILSFKYSQKPPDHAKQSAINTHKNSSKRVIQKTKATDDLIGNKIANRIKKPSRSSPQSKPRWTHNEDNLIRFKTSMFRSGLCDYSNPYMLAKGTITVGKTAAQDQPNNAVSKKVILKNCASFTYCISRIKMRK